MADAITTVTIVHAPGEPPATVAARLLVDDPSRGLAGVASELEQIAGGVRGGRVHCLVESTAAVAATGTVVVSAADCTAGDILRFFIGDGQVIDMTAVALDATVTASPLAGYYSLETATDDAVGASLATNMNRHPALSRYVQGSNSSGTVTLTAQKAGARGNSIDMVKVVTTAGALTLTQLTGGYDGARAPSETCTLGGAALTANDTITIGSVVLTWKASAANENEITIGGSDAASLANLTAKINAHSKLQGLVSAADDGATVCTITWLGPPRAGELLYYAKSASNASAMVITGSGTFRSNSTEAYQAARKVWARGVSTG